MTDAAFTFGPEADAPTPTPTAAPVRSGSVLDALTDDSVDMLRAASDDFPVPSRPGWSVRCSTYESWEDWNRLNDQTDDQLTLASLVLIEHCHGIVCNGELATGSDGKAVTFRSAELHQRLGAIDAQQAVRRLFRHDGDILRVAAAVRAASGWDLSKPVDPTKPQG